MPTIIILTDNYLDDKTSDTLYPIDNYETKHATDVTVYVQQDQPHEILTAHNVQSAKTKIIATYKDKNKTKLKHIFIGIYRRPHHDNNFIPNLQEMVEEIQHKYPNIPITIVGILT